MVAILATLAGCSGAQRFVVVGPVSYVGKRVGTFEVKEGGRIAYGYTPAELARLVGVERFDQLGKVAESDDPRRPFDDPVNAR